MAQTKKVIKVPKGAVEKIQKAYNCSRQTVYAALSYRTGSEMSAKIRKDALQVYGGITTKQLFNY